MAKWPSATWWDERHAPRGAARSSKDAEAAAPSSNEAAPALGAASASSHGTAGADATGDGAAAAAAAPLHASVDLDDAYLRCSRQVPQRDSAMHGGTISQCTTIELTRPFRSGIRHLPCRQLVAEAFERRRPAWPVTAESGCGEDLVPDRIECPTIVQFCSSSLMSFAAQEAGCGGV